MPQSEYWEERFLLLNEMLLQMGEEYIKHSANNYVVVISEIEKEINNFYARFANENSITYQEAKQILTTQERQAFQMELQEYIEYGQKNGLDNVWIKKLENASTLHRITRLQAIQYQLQQQVEKLEAKKVQGLTEVLKNIHKDGYYKTAYEIQKGTGIGQAFSKIDENRINKVLIKPWAADGKNFSERIWGQDRTQLIYQLETRFTQGIIRGETPQKIIADMSKTLNASKKNMERLVMTESAFVASASRKDSYENLGVKQYKVLATLDLKTSDLCRNMDGKIFDLKDYKIGVTANPFHPRCRTTTIPHIDDSFIQNQQRAARDKEGKTCYVPADMTYKEWYKTYVEADSEWLLQEKKLKNKNADKKQYEEYKTVLGKKEVGSFDNFQNIKYTDSKKWNSIKKKVRQEDNKPYDIRICKGVSEQEIIEERKVVEQVFAEMPKKVQRALKKGTVIEIGREGSSGYDPNDDKILIAKGADKSQVRHEVGHMVDNKLMNQKRIESLKREILGEVTIDDIYVDTTHFVDNMDNPKEVFFVKNNALISEYQGRVYKCEYDLQAFNDDGEFKYENMWDFMSEPYELYFSDEAKLQKECPKLHDYIKEVIT